VQFKGLKKKLTTSDGKSSSESFGILKMFKGHKS
jgi:hypothetical protein